MSVLRRGLATWARKGVSFIGLCAAAGAFAAPPLYRIAEAPTEGGIPVAKGINDRGVIVGTLYGDTGERRAFRWHEGRPVDFAPVDDPRHEQYAISIDELGAISYWVQWPGIIFPGKFLRTEVWRKGAAPAKKLRGVYSFFGNTAGDLIVRGDKRSYALRERDGALTDIGRGDDDFLLNDLNNLQQAVGVRGAGRPVLWARGKGVTEIPALPDKRVSAAAINDKGDVALMTSPFDLTFNGPENGPNTIHLWSADKGVQSLGEHADCVWYRPRKVGPQGTMVGDCFAEPTPLSAQHAFAADAVNGIYMLESQIDPADPNATRYEMRRALGINASGQIAVEAMGRNAEGPKLLLLTPVR
ncbi:hypothetical protein [Ideonella sp.]|uniref:hypothetical protein n=1 Tax=Ideonella sp. TaxID=1929293 RepID=UPI0035B2DB52